MASSERPGDGCDPFEGYPPTDVRCRWLSNRDERAASSAEIIRLIVDDQRGTSEPWANDAYQRNLLADLQRFIGSTRSVIVTDAGAIKSYIPRLEAGLQSLRVGLATLESSLSTCALGGLETLLGVDGCVRGEATPLQAIVHLKKRPEVSFPNAAVKIYPAPEESRHLIGWLICEAFAAIPAELAEGRIATTSIGRVLNLVCHDAAIFSARFRANARDDLKLAIRDRFLEQATAGVGVDYVLIATHWQGMNAQTSRWSGNAFREAAAFLAAETGATVVTTMRTPLRTMEQAAERFEVIGLRSDRVATLLVSDARG